jgi:hypothetical protein
MKRMCISLRKRVAVAILVLTVVFLAPATVPAGEANTHRPDIQKPGTLKELLKKMEITPNKPGAQFNYLFKLEVPVELQKVHPSVKKAAIYCLVSNSDPNPPSSSYKATLTEIPLQGGAYTGIINVYITELAYPEHKSELIDQYECGLVFVIDGVDAPFVSPAWQSGQDPIGGAHKRGTPFNVNVEGKF